MISTMPCEARPPRALRQRGGCSDYIDSEAVDPAKALLAMGRAEAIIATVANPQAMEAIASGLGVNGVMMAIGAVGNLTINSLALLMKRASVKGWYSGTSAASEDTLQFSESNAIGSMNEVYPLEQTQAGYDRMVSGQARFRLVLKM